MRVCLSDIQVKTLTSKGKPQLDAHDTLCPGLCFRVSKSGRKTWTFVYTSPRDQSVRRITFGTYPAISLADARTRAVELRERVRAGTDPQDEPDPAQADRPRLVKDVAADFLEMEIKGQDSADATKRRLNSNILPQVGDVPIRAFAVPHLNKILDPINGRGSPVEANRTLGVVHRFLDFAVSRGEIAHNPIPAPVRKKRLNKEKKSERNLSRDEIVTFWNTVDDVLAKSDCIPAALKLSLVTGQRIGEVIGMSRSELHLDDRLWTIPKERVKNDRDHDVPLSDMALAIIRDRLRAIGDGEYLFPDESGEAPLEVGPVDKTVARALAPTDTQPLGRWGMVKWTPHALRHSVITQMRDMRNRLFPSIVHARLVSSMVVNHRSEHQENVTDSVYDQNDYLDVKREALENWATFLSGLVAGDNVVPLVRAA